MTIPATITIHQLEVALRRCCAAQPPVNYQFSHEVRLLSGLWGDMVHRRQRTLALGRQTPLSCAVLERWLAAPAEVAAAATLADAGSGRLPCAD